MATSTRGTINLSHRNLIQFVPSGRSDCVLDKWKGKTQELKSNDDQLGKEAKAFYENLLSETEAVPKTETISKAETAFNSEAVSSSSHLNIVSTCSENSSKNKSRKKRSQSSATKKSKSKTPEKTSQTFFKSTVLNLHQRQYFKLLQCAEQGQTNEVVNLLGLGLDVNFQDFYGWTALMCAAREGHADVIKTLLESGADKNLRNSVGDDACLIARNACHLKLANFIRKFYVNEEKNKQFIESKSHLEAEDAMFYCEICKQKFLLHDQKSHYSSTIHLFNTGKRKSGPSFFITENNRGYQMLLRSGWSGDKGLGPDGKGAKYPVKTILKQDRKCLGSGEDVKKKAKISHFNANDKRAVEPIFKKMREFSVRTLAKKAQTLKEKKEKRLEKNIRFQFS